MLKELHLKNYRTHENLILKFHQGVNVIWGIGGSGKSNILRSVYWISSNKSSFDSIVAPFAKSKEVEVTAIFDNGTVTLKKTPTTGTYSDSNGNSFSFGGATVPESIAKLINLNEINIAKQLDPHFLITSTPGDVGATINRITKIEKIDEWVSKLTTLSNKSKWAAEAAEKECEVLEKELKQYDGLEDLEAVVQQFDELNTRISVIGNRLIYLKKTDDRMQNLQSRIDELEEIDIESHMQILNLIIKDCDSKEKRISTLTTKKKRYTFILNRKQKLDGIVQDINFDGFEELIKDVNTKAEQYSRIASYVDAQGKCSTAKHSLENAKNEYLKAIKELGTCPICQSVMSLEHIHNLEASL